MSGAGKRGERTSEWFFQYSARRFHSLSIHRGDVGGYGGVEGGGGGVEEGGVLGGRRGGGEEGAWDGEKEEGGCLGVLIGEVGVEKVKEL